MPFFGGFLARGLPGHIELEVSKAKVDKYDWKSIVTKHSPEPPAPRLTAFFKTREEMEASERAVLAPFAEKSGDSRGRQNSEPGHAFRTEFQRDRARIIHSRAFRRM